jgi:hypothetical protein
MLPIEINEELSGSGADGLVVTSAATVRGLVINIFQHNVVLHPGRLEGCFIRTDPSGTIARSRPDATGVDAGGSAIVGGLLPSQRNVISGNQGFGIHAAGNFIQGNFIGVDATGTVALSPPAAPSVWTRRSPRGRPWSEVRRGSRRRR